MHVERSLDALDALDAPGLQRYWLNSLRTLSELSTCWRAACLRFLCAMVLSQGYDISPRHTLPQECQWMGHLGDLFQ